MLLATGKYARVCTLRRRAPYKWLSAQQRKLHLPVKFRKAESTEAKEEQLLVLPEGSKSAALHALSELHKGCPCTLSERTGGRVEFQAVFRRTLRGVKLRA